MSYINITVSIEDVWEDISDRDLIKELRKRIKEGSIKTSDLSGIPVKIEEAYSDNLIEDMKLRDILPNLWKKSPQEIEQFFGKA